MANPILVMGIVLLSAAGSVAQTTGTITWALRAQDADGNPIPRGSVLDPAGSFPLDPRITFIASVTVTGNNQGLGGFLLDFSVRMDNPFSGAIPGTGIAADWAYVYKAPGGASGGAIKDEGAAGGPGMGVLASLGWPESGYAYIAQIGASHLDWTPRGRGTYGGGGSIKKWLGDDTWGVGRDERKAVLLDESAGVSTYDVFSVAFDHTGQLDCTYYACIVPAPSGNAVLNAGLDLNVYQGGSINTAQGAYVTVAGDAFALAFVPEPATFLLFAGAAWAWLPRRQPR